MADELLHIGDGFWNIRGSYRLAGVLNIGTQCSLVRLARGGFVLLDSYTLSGEVEREVMDLTDEGRAIEAVLNLHPYHTEHVRSVAERLPHAKLYGTARHVEREPELPWERLLTTDPELHDLFARDLEFSVPRGVDFISDNEKVHFSSVLAFHDASRTLHVDDTLTWTELPLIGGLRFHPTLRWALQDDPAAVPAFRAWANALIARCETIEHICTAHMRSSAPDAGEDGLSVADRVREAFKDVDDLLSRHAREHASGA